MLTACSHPIWRCFWRLLRLNRSARSVHACVAHVTGNFHISGIWFSTTKCTGCFVSVSCNDSINVSARCMCPDSLCLVNVAVRRFSHDIRMHHVNAACGYIAICICICCSMQRSEHSCSVAQDLTFNMHHTSLTLLNEFVYVYRLTGQAAFGEKLCSRQGNSIEAFIHAVQQGAI